MSVDLEASSFEDEKIVKEFCVLLEKSKQLFNGLRDLPSHGHREWQAYFGRTFDVYTRLWKYQQQHRTILDQAYGLKRWQIGDIASKIGQLYYHYYLRTSETSYLTEAFAFYAAIRSRAYYSRTAREDRADLMVKKLRYYARFIIVCLLLKKMKLVRDLAREMAKNVEEYNADDRPDWAMVLAEVKNFIEADSVVSVLDSDSNSIVLSQRLGLKITPHMDKSPAMNLSLQEVIIVGSITDQAKFSELTLDMFRMLQTLEREPHGDLAQVYDVSPSAHGPPFENGSSTVMAKRENPHKYLLYKPTVSQFLVFLASGQRELPVHGALMLYLSGEGYVPNKQVQGDPRYDCGGVLLSLKIDPVDSMHSGVSLMSNNKRPQPPLSSINCLYPGDLECFSRRPLFIIVESSNATAFSKMTKRFGQPLVVLMSPQEIPLPFQNEAHKGSLYTLFLHSPLSAFCFVTNIVDIPIRLWDTCLAHIDRFLTEAYRLVLRCSGGGSAFTPFMGDDFLRLLVCRHIFASVVLRIHLSFITSASRPTSWPTLPELDMLENPILQRYVIDLAKQLAVRHHFVDCAQID